MELSTCACCNELKAPSRTRTASIEEEGGSWLARIRTRLTWEHTTFACFSHPAALASVPHGVVLVRVRVAYSAEVIDSTKRLHYRKAEVARDYLKRAARIDELNGHPPGSDGPMATALKRYNGGRVLVFVVGAFAETSEDVSHICNIIAQDLARTHVS